MITVLIIGFVVLLGLLIPCLIVMFWQKRPAVAFIIALFLGFVFSAAPGIIRTFQAMMIYGTGDPQLAAGGISEALVSALLGTIIYIPFLFLFQWLGRLRKRKRDQEALDRKTFD